MLHCVHGQEDLQPGQGFLCRSGKSSRIQVSTITPDIDQLEPRMSALIREVSNYAK